MIYICYVGYNMILSILRIFLWEWIFYCGNVIFFLSVVEEVKVINFNVVLDKL